GGKQEMRAVGGRDDVVQRGVDSPAACQHVDRDDEHDESVDDGATKAREHADQATNHAVRPARQRGEHLRLHGLERPYQGGASQAALQPEQLVVDGGHVAGEIGAQLHSLASQRRDQQEDAGGEDRAKEEVGQENGQPARQTVVLAPVDQRRQDQSQDGGQDEQDQRIG